MGEKEEYRGLSASLGVNVGTSRIKGVILDGLELAHELEMTISRPKNTCMLWKSLRSFFRELLREYPLTNVAALSISGRSPTLVGLRKRSRKGPVLGWGGPASDEKEGDSLFMDSLAAKLKGLDARLYDDSVFFLNPHEYLTYMLTGMAFSSTPSNSYHTWGGDLSEANERITKHLVSPEKVAPSKVIGSLVGNVTTEAARVTGLSIDAKVYVGGWDYQMDLIGSGAFISDDFLIRIGSTVGINALVDGRMSSDQFFCSPLFIKGKWVLGKVIPSSWKRGESEEALVALALRIKNSVRQLQAIVGTNRDLLISGGMAFSTMLPRALSKLMSRRIQRASSIASEAMGCAIVASVSSGLAHNYESYVRTLTSGRTEFSP